MKLYDLPHGAHFRIIDEKVKVPVAAPEANPDETYWFGHIDGMYSYCKDADKNVVHFAAWTEVEEITE